MKKKTDRRNTSAGFNIKWDDTRKFKMCNNKDGEGMDVQQEKLADKIGAHKSVVSRIERGKYHNDLSLATLLKISEKLNIDPSCYLPSMKWRKNFGGSH